MSAAAIRSQTVLQIIGRQTNDRNPRQEETHDN